MVNKYYQKHKERLRKEACERYQNLPEVIKGRKRFEGDMQIFLKNKSRNFLII